MSRTLGINVNWNETDSPTSARLDWIRNQGFVLIRSQDNSAANITTVFNREGCYVMPLALSTSFSSYIDTLYDGSGNPIPGFCGVVELLNEPYGTWASPHYSNGGDYYDAVRSSIITAKGRHPNVKFLLSSVAPGRPNGSSVPGGATWLADIFARASSHGDDLTKLVYGFSAHMYTSGNNVLLKNSSGQYVWPSIPWQIKAYNDLLVNNRATSLVLWDCESGAGEAGNGDPDAAFSDTTQQQWYQNKIGVFQNPTSYVPGISMNWEVWHPFCLLTGGLPAGSGNTDAKAWGLIVQNNFSDGPGTAPAKIRPALADVRSCSNTLKAAGATGNFTGASTPPPTTDSLTIAAKASDASKVQITHIPTGTDTIHVAFAQANDGTGLEFLGYPTADLKIADFGGSWPATPFDYNKAIPADHPAVQMIAQQAAADIGTWTAFVTTTPAPATAVPTATTDPATSVASTTATLNGHADAHGVSGATFHFELQQLLNGAAQASVLLPTPDVAVGDVAATLLYATEQHGSVTNGTSISVTSTNANGFTTGRLMVAVIEAKGIAQTQTTITPPVTNGTWILDGDYQFTNSGNGAHRVSVYHRFAGAAEVAESWTFSQSGAGVTHEAEVMAFDGADPTTPVRVVNFQTNNATLTPVAPSSSVVAGDLLVYGTVYTNDTTTAVFPTTTPVSTERADFNAGASGAGVSLAVGTQPVSATGSSGTRTVTLTDGSLTATDNTAGFMIVLKPAATGGTTNKAISWPATGLTASGTYQYRASVTSTGGTNIGAWVPFSTPATGQTGTAPTVVTNDLTAVTETTAALNGHVIPNGLTTTYHFEYGTTTAYGTSQPSPDASAGLSETDVSALLVNLTPNTVYHYRVVATNSAGTTNGPDQTFTTHAAPPPITPDGAALSDLRSELKARGFDFLDDTRCDNFINDGYQELCEYAPWPFLETTTTGSAPLGLGDLRQVLYVVDTTTNTPLAPLDARDVANADPSMLNTSGARFWWFDNLTINVWPQNATDSLTVRYVRVPSRLTDDSDVTIVPSRYSSLITDLAQIRALGLDSDNWQEVQALRGEVDRKLSQMLLNLANRAYDFPKVQRVYGP